MTHFVFIYGVYLVDCSSKKNYSLQNQEKWVLYSI